MAITYYNLFYGCGMRRFLKPCDWAEHPSSVQVPAISEGGEPGHPDMARSKASSHQNRLGFIWIYIAL